MEWKYTLNEKSDFNIETLPAKKVTRLVVMFYF